jgi:hypothetical protein
MKYYIHRNRHRIIKSVILLAVIATLLIGARFYVTNSGEVVSTLDGESQELSADKIVALEAKVLNFGSLSWADGSVDHISSQTPFSSLSQFTRSDYDAWIGNLNCPVVSQKTTSSCDELKVPDFAKYYSMLALGGLRNTNGIDDQNTAEKLAKSGIQYFGKISSTKNPEECEVISVPARFRLKDDSFKSASMPIVLCAVDGEKTNAVDISSEISKYAKSLPVWVYALDSGISTVQERQTQYRSYIDAGADLVLGVASPELASTEVYEGRLIVYSLGRFLGPVDPTTKSEGSALISIGITAAREGVIEWEKIARTCTGYDDLCIEAATSQSLVKPKYSYMYSVVAVDSSDARAPKLADVALTGDILSTMKWFDTNTQLLASSK